MRHLQFLLLLPLLGSLLLQTGCQNYQLGSQLPPDIKSVYVPTVRNQTDEPLLENEVTQAILNELQRDGSLSIESEETADAILYVNITSYEIKALSFDNENRARPDEYRLILGASVEMVRSSNGQILSRNGSLRGREDFPLSGDLTTAKRNGLPGAADDLARFVVSAITEAWPD
jgi:outer membrane lipopolysaccharide assembly protein LptE/RlpB